MKSLKIGLLIAALIGAVFLLKAKQTNDGQLNPDERACLNETKTAFLGLNERQIAAMPGSPQDNFVAAMIECIGRKRIVREKMQ